MVIRNNAIRLEIERLANAAMKNVLLDKDFKVWYSNRGSFPNTFNERIVRFFATGHRPTELDRENLAIEVKRLLG